MISCYIHIFLLLASLETTRKDSAKAPAEAAGGFAQIPSCVTGARYLDCSDINVELSRTSVVLYDGQKDGGALLRSIMNIGETGSFILSVITTAKSRGRGISSCPLSILRNPRHRRERGFSIGHRASETELEVPTRFTPHDDIFHVLLYMWRKPRILAVIYFVCLYSCLGQSFEPFNNRTQVRICDGKALFSHTFQHDGVTVGKRINRTISVTALASSIVVAGQLDATQQTLATHI